jgi:2-aminobenzoate-CoA ligase
MMEPSAHVDTFARDNLPPQDQWPVCLLDNPDVAYPPRLNCAAELLERTIEAGHRDRPAIWSDVDGKPQATTYGELLAMVNRSAHVLVAFRCASVRRRCWSKSSRRRHCSTWWNVFMRL